MTARDELELRCYRARDVRFAVTALLDGILAPAMLPARGVTLRRVCDDFQTCDDDLWQDPVEHAVSRAVGALALRLGYVHRGWMAFAREHDPDETLWGIEP